jgi:hypothetical protein
MNEFNAQQQPKITWEPTFIVAKAYLDQLARSKGISPARLAAVKTAIGRADRNNPDRAALTQLDTIASQLEQDAGAVSGRDADRLRALAAAIKGRAARLRG